MRIVTEVELRDKIRPPRFGVVLTFPPGTRFSPSAQDFIKHWQVEVRFEEPSPQVSSEASETPQRKLNDFS